jgi:hypothetical protein
MTLRGLLRHSHIDPNWQLNMGLRHRYSCPHQKARE